MTHSAILAIAFAFSVSVAAMALGYLLSRRWKRRHRARRNLRQSREMRRTYESESSIRDPDAPALDPDRQ